MHERLRRYIEQLFATAPKTQSAQELKDEMLQNLIDKYDDLVREGKSEEDAYDAAIAGVGDISGLIGGQSTAQPYTRPAQPEKPKPKQKNPVVLTVAIILYVLCAVPTIAIGGVTGVALMFVLIAAATAMILMNRTLVHPTRAAFVAVGVALCILCPVPPICMGNVLGVALLFVLLAAGVGLIVYSQSEKYGVAPEPAEEGFPSVMKYGAIALATVCALLLAGAIISDSTKHKRVEYIWYDAADSAMEKEERKEEIKDAVGDVILDGVQEAAGPAGAVAAPFVDEITGNDKKEVDGVTSATVDVDGVTGATVDSDHDYDDDDDDDDDKKKSKKGAVAATIMEGAVEVPTTGINEIDIDWVGGSVQVAPYSGSTIAISETASTALTESQKLRYSIQGSKLQISYCEDTLHVWDWLDFDKLGMPKKALTLQLPAGVFGELEINAVSADIFVSGTTFDELDLESVNGDITVTDLSGRKLDVQTTSGKAKLTNVDVMKLDLQTTSGAYTVTGSKANEVDLETISGEMTLALTSTPSKLESEAISGNVTLSLPANATNFSVEMESVSGDFDCAVAGTSQNGRFVAGSGAARFEIQSVSGDFTIKTK